MSYLLLQDPKVCPACHFKTYPRHFRECSCGVMLFLRPIDFEKYEADGGLANYWCLHKQYGWQHRDHLMIKDAAIQIREWKGEELPENYGKHITPEQIAARGR